jgi:ATP-dependent helicase YprA (DUF1998 family)
MACHLVTPLARSFETAIALRSLYWKNRMPPNFDALGLRPELLRAVRELGFTVPTPVQIEAIPPALAGRDVLASAQTGTGKTAAFGLPLLQAIAELPPRRTHALVLAPTRELAAQIAVHLTELARHTKIRVRAVFGGVGYGQQMQAFKTGVEIIVATPGRLIDHLQQGARLDGVSMLVLDEADRMLDMGFLPAVRKIVAKLPARTQTLFFSATIAPEIVKLTREILHDPVRVTIAPKSAAPTAEGVTHVAYTIDQQRKTDLLVELLKDNNIYSALAFTRTKARANRLALALEKHNVSAERLHACAGRLQARESPRARRDRPRGSRDRHRRPRARGELRRADGGRGLRPPRRAHSASRVDRRRDHLRVARGRAALPRHREDRRPPDRPFEPAGVAAGRSRAGVRAPAHGLVPRPPQLPRPHGEPPGALIFTRLSPPTAGGTASRSEVGGEFPR